MAVAALSRREVNRIILTRPAVEAGERLGFLPGDLMAKVDPYLRPLFDAMNDMLDPERVTAHLEKGVIEVAPLAFMRGRAQPVDQPVLTPGRLAADRIAARRRPRRRVRRPADAGARRLPAGPPARLPRHGAGRRIDPLLRRAPVDGQDAGGPPPRQPAGRCETDEMIGRLRAHHQHRFELPLLSVAGRDGAQPVPIDPTRSGCCSATAA